MRIRIQALVYFLLWLLPLVASILAAQWCWSYSRLVDHSQRTMGKVIAYEHRWWSLGGGKGAWQHVHTLQYAGIAREVTLGREYPPGTSFHVRYLPANPLVMDLAADPAAFEPVNRTFRFLGWVATPALLLAALFCAWRAVRNLARARRPDPDPDAIPAMPTPRLASACVRRTIQHEKTLAPASPSARGAEP